jgi:hypothetical protein
LAIGGHQQDTGILARIGLGANGSKNVVLEVQRDWDQHYKGKVSERLGKKCATSLSKASNGK